MSIQGRRPDPTGTNQEGIWVDPMRDVAHSVPYIIQTALHAAMTDITALPEDEQAEAEDGMKDYALKLAKFVKLCAGPDRPQGEKAKQEAFIQSGLLQSSDASRLFTKWFTRAVLGFYFDGVGNALHPGEKPLGVQELMEAVNDIQAG